MGIPGVCQMLGTPAVMQSLTCNFYFRMGMALYHCYRGNFLIFEVTICKRQQDK